jgi:hypothetical protein
MIRAEFRSLPFKPVVAVHDLVGSSAVWESDVCANTLGQKQNAPIMTSTQPKATVFGAGMPIGQPPIAFGLGDLLLCRRPGPSSYVEN